MVPEELKGRRGQPADGTAKTRQAYLGWVFTQHRVEQEGHPVRDWEPTTDVLSCQSIEEIGPVLRPETLRRGLASAGKAVLLIDGAVGLENIGRLNFKERVQSVDFYHALKPAGKVLRALIGNDQPDSKKRQRRWARRLLKAGVASLIRQTRNESEGRAGADAVAAVLGYWVRQVDRMQ